MPSVVVERIYYITGTPNRPRSWYANLVANPEVTFHVEQSATTDLPAIAGALRLTVTPAPQTDTSAQHVSARSTRAADGGGEHRQLSTESSAPAEAAAHTAWVSARADDSSICSPGVQ
ncbi:hypothetical protein [Subtercola sp. RTI3]|uniref:hypothetical protein n=1 Tax=Subtercola sp. RTI3 TaxID=3048639 RepID=UPI002B23A67C|nr:hypothetical protein [Subtercola sp. RTI3]MEA9986847.1 hypothetical protein [Subtercola sp. RTI3]